MTTEQSRPRPLFGVMAASAPFILGCFAYEWDAIADLANPADRLLFTLVILCVTALLGMTLATVAIVRRERWRTLAVTGLVVNAVLLALLVLAVAVWLAVRNTKVVHLPVPDPPWCSARLQTVAALKL